MDELLLLCSPRASDFAVSLHANSVQRKNPFGAAVVAHPFHFDQPGKLVESVRGVDTLSNTYWVRFDHRLLSHDQAVRNTNFMFKAAKEAGANDAAWNVQRAFTSSPRKS